MNKNLIRILTRKADSDLMQRKRICQSNYLIIYFNQKLCLILMAQGDGSGILVQIPTRIPIWKSKQLIISVIFVEAFVKFVTHLLFYWTTKTMHTVFCLYVLSSIAQQNCQSKFQIWEVLFQFTTNHKLIVNHLFLTTATCQRLLMHI